MVILDSGHSKQHVLGELDAYSDLVSVGSYLVAADGIMRDGIGSPRTKPEWSYDNPRAAVDDFLASHPAFVREEPPWGFNESVGLSQSITYWRGGWLRRVPVSLDPDFWRGRRVLVTGHNPASKVRGFAFGSIGLELRWPDLRLSRSRNRISSVL